MFNLKNIVLITLPFSFAIASLPVVAQQIVPNNDGTMTVITKDGNSFNIDGGKLSQDGKNLFHSFEEFGLDAGQIANFLANPDIQNILGRINGGNPSVIDGLLQVTGGNSNLYLMNPAGIVFGDNASLNVPGDFAATTATGIGIGDGWFNAVGSNDYLNLTGNPHSFDFSATDGGTIINAGNLEIAQGHNISLTAGTVINTGTIQAPGGNITVAAIPGTNRIRISQQGQILNLEVEIPTDESGEQLPVKVTDLPNLLRGLPEEIETGVEVATNNEVTLANSKTPIEAGDLTAKEVRGNKINFWADNNISLVESEIIAGGDLNLKAGDTIFIRDSKNNPFIAKAEGNLTLQGTQKIDIFALNSPDSGLASGENLVLRSQNTVDGDAHYVTGGDFRIEQLDGKPGNLHSPFDPVVRSLGDVFLQDYTGASLHILAGGQINITGSVIITNPDTTNSLNETVTLSDGTTQVAIDGSSQPTLDLRAGIDWNLVPGGLSGNSVADPGDFSLTPFLSNDATNADITVGSILFESPDGTILLSNQYNPNTALTGGDITVDFIDGNSVSAFVGTTPSIYIDSRNNITFLNETISIFNNPVDSGNAGSVFFKAVDNITIPSPIRLSANFDAGSVFLNAEGNIDTDGIFVSSFGDGNSGDINIVAGGNINLGRDINAGSLTTEGTGTTFLNGNVTTVADQTYNTPLSLNQNGDTTLQGNDLNFNAPIELGTGDKVVNLISQNRIEDDGNIDDGDVTFSPEADLDFNGVGNGALNIEADNNINLGDEDGDFDEVADRLEITDNDPTTTDSLNLTLTSDRDNNDIGALESNFPFSFITNGGDVTISSKDELGLYNASLINSGGGNINLTGSHFGTTGNSEGIEVNDSDLISEGGNITLTGTTADDNEGIKIISSQINSGNVNVFGGGDITLTGTSNGEEGISITSPRSNEPVLDARGGNISLTGITNNFAGIVIRGGDLNDDELFSTAIDGNNLTLTADEIDLAASSPSNAGVTLLGGNNLLIQPHTPELDITIAGTENPNSLDLTNDDLAAIQGDFDRITFGRDNSSGTLTVTNNLNFDRSVVLQSPAASGAIAINGEILTSRDSLTLNAGDNVTATQNIITNGGAIEIDSGGAIETTNLSSLEENTSEINFNEINLNAGEDITTGNINSSGNPNGGSVTITSTGGTISTGDINNINLGNSEIPDNISLDEITGNINLSSPNGITTGYINSSGNINIDTNDLVNNSQGLFTATGTIPETNTSVRGTNVTIQHGGGNREPRISFTVGNAEVNGTVGDIVTSESITTVNSFPNSEISPNATIQILTTDEGEIVLPVIPPTNEGELPIVAAEDGTGSIVTAAEDGVTFNLTGGLTSNDLENQNLFHSYSRFDLPETNQTANFIVGEGIQNVLARVSSGDASELAGTIQITGSGNPNLFLINPAGVIFGEQASLNIPGDFTVTTANGVGFGEGWFSATGNFGNPIDDNPQTVTLNGNPTRIAVSDNNAGTIVNLENNTVTAVEEVADLPNDFDVEIPENQGINAGEITANSDFITNGNNLTLVAENEINLTAIDSSVDSVAEVNDRDNRAGDITIVSTDGGIDLNSPQGIFAYGTAIDGGDVTLYAEGDINLIGIVSGSKDGDGGNITITSNNENIEITQELVIDSNGDGAIDNNDTNLDLGLIVSGAGQNGGNVTLEAAGDIETGYIYAGTFSNPDPNLKEAFTGGEISLNSTRGEIDASAGVEAEYINNISAVANRLAEDDLELEPTNIAERLIFELPEDARNNPDFSLTDTILSGISSFSINNSGVIALTTSAEDRDITVSTINAESAEGNSGEINVVSQRFFRATEEFVTLLSNLDLTEGDSIESTEETFPAANVSISTFSPEGNAGDITISHGGKGQTSFTIGNATENGTAGNIYSNNFPFSLGESFFFTEIRDNISIISVDGATIDRDNPDPGEFISQPAKQQVATNPNFNSPLNIASIPEAQQILLKIAESAAQKPALAYINFTPETLNLNSTAEDSFLNSENCRTAEYQASLGIQQTDTAPGLCIAPQPSDRLEILLITSEGEPIYLPVDVTREEVEKEAKKLYRQTSRPSGKYYKSPAKKLYQWLIGAIEADLKEREIDNLLFIMPPKLRSLPIAALYDAENEIFLAQKEYNVGFAPSLNLMNTQYRNIQESPVLAFGASDFEAAEEQEALPAVEIELPVIEQLRGGKTILNENFTLENLQENLGNRRPAIVHLSTHADFNPQNVDDIYIQLYDRKLTLNQLKELELNDPVVDLLVISACRSAFGDNEAELGFGGLAVKAGVKTAIGSLWYVGDTSTSALMSEFYHQLKTSPTKAEALRKAQQAVIEQQVKNSEAEIITTWGSIPLPEHLKNEDNQNIDWSHPYFWAPFTVIGSPW